MRKKMFVWMCVLMMVLLCGISGLAAEQQGVIEKITTDDVPVVLNKEESLERINFMVSEEWEHEYGNGSIEYYYPVDGYDEIGNRTALFMTQCVFVGSHDSEKEITDLFNEFENGMLKDGSVRLIKENDTEVCEIMARLYTGEQTINERKFDIYTMIFVYDKDLYTLSMLQEQGFKKNYLPEYEKMLSSITLDKIYTKYTFSESKIGRDMPAGEYIVFASGGSGYFCVSSDSNQDDILFNDNFEYNSIITVNDGEYLELSRCYAIPVEENPEVELTGEGMFKVGTHIPAGEYKVDSGNDMGYYCIYSDSRQSDIIANDNFKGQNYVTVSDGQYLVLSRCKFTDTPEKSVPSYTDSETIRKVQEETSFFSTEGDVVQDEQINNTEIDEEKIDLFNTESMIQSELIGIEKNTNDSLNKVIEIARNDAATVTEAQINEAINAIRTNYPQYYNGSEQMELYMYYGYLLDFAFDDTDPRSELGMDLYQAIKYVYRGTETVLDTATKENLDQIEADLQKIN